MPKLCKLSKKKLEKNIDEYLELVDQPKYICLKCGRACNKKSYVCKPYAMDK